MTRFSKKQLPSAKDRSHRTTIALAAGALCLLGLYSYRKNKTTVKAPSMISHVGYDESDKADETLQMYDLGIDFQQVRPRIGELMPVSWKDDGETVTPNAYRMLIPSKLTRAMKEYCDKVGLTDLARNYISAEENNIEPGECMRHFAYVSAYLDWGLTIFC